MFQNPFDLQDQRFLITGASSGIGRVIAMALSNYGAQIILVGRDVNRLQDTKNKLLGDHHVVEAFDLSQTEHISAWLKKLTETHGPLNGLVHSAGLHSAKPLRFLDSGSFSAVFKINVEAAVFLAKGLRQKNVYIPGASLVLMSSVVGLVGQVGVCAYSSSKGALIALSKSLALELAPEKIRVNAVAPGVVRSEMTEELFSKMLPEQIAQIEKMHPLGFGDPEDVAHAVAYLLSPAAKWVTGTSLIIDGGYTAQ